MIGSVVSWERDKIITVICAMNAEGTSIPLMFIFPKQNLSYHIQKDRPIFLNFLHKHTTFNI